MKIRNKSLVFLSFFVLGILVPLQLSTFTANAATIDDSTISASATEVSPGSSATITVYAVNVTGDLDGVDVFFQSTEGNFQGTGASENVVTNSSGHAVIVWEAPFVDFTNDSSVVNITAQIQNGAQIKDLFVLITVKHLDTSFIDGSEFIDPSPIVFGEKKELTFVVKDNSDVPMEGAQITAEETTANGTIEGELDSDITGLTNANGEFKFNWTADVQHGDEIERSIQFEFLVEAGAEASLTINAEFFVTQFAATSLTVTITGALEIESGTDTLIDVLLEAGSSPAEDANVTLTVDQGEFSNTDTQILLTANSSGRADVLYTAPVVTTNTTISINGDAELLSLTGTGNLDILVYVVERDFEATMSFSDDLVKQNESLTVTVTVTDKETTDPVQGATVSFLLELGVWSENDEALYSATTNAQGVATATFDGSNTAMILQIQKINVTATVTGENYADLEISGNFSLEKLPDVFAFTATASSTEITYGASITITVDATINTVAFSNATVHFFTQSGSFDDGTSDYRAKTDAQGNLVVTWDSSSLPALTESRPIFIEVDLVNSGLEKILLTITVNPEGGQTTSTSDDGDGGDDGLFDDPLVIGGIVATVGLVGVGAAVLRRGS